MLSISTYTWDPHTSSNHGGSPRSNRLRSGELYHGLPATEKADYQEPFISQETVSNLPRANLFAPRNTASEQLVNVVIAYEAGLTEKSTEVNSY
jgi:hypothetical protein